MTPRLLQTRARRRYRAGARLALFVSLLVGVGASSLVGASAPSAEISHHEPAPAAAEPGPAPLPDPQVEPASLQPRMSAPQPAVFLHLDGPVDYVPSPVVPEDEVERLIL